MHRLILILNYVFVESLQRNVLNIEIKNSTSLSQFKNQLLKMIRLEGNPVYNISDIAGVRLLNKLRLKFNELNELKFRHNLDSLTPFCAFVGETR